MSRLMTLIASTLHLVTICSTIFFSPGSVRGASKLAGVPATSGGSTPKAADIKAESAWFQLSHFGKTLLAADARTKARQQASELPKLASTANSPSSSIPAATWGPLGPQPINTNSSWGWTVGGSRHWPSTRPTAAISGNYSLSAQGGPRFLNQERSLERRVEQVHTSFEGFMYPPVHRLYNLALLDPYLYTQEAPA